MGVDNREGIWQLEGEMGEESDGMYVEKRDGILKAVLRDFVQVFGALFRRCYE